MARPKQTPNPEPEPTEPEPIILGALPRARKPRGKSDDVLLRWSVLDGMADDAGAVTIHEHALGHEDDASEPGDVLYIVGTGADGKPAFSKVGEPEPEGFTPNVLAHFERAFPITGEQMGVAESSVPVTIAAWAKDRGLPHSVPTKYGTPLVVLL